MYLWIIHVQLSGNVHNIVNVHVDMVLCIVLTTITHCGDAGENDVVTVYTEQRLTPLVVIIYMILVL